MTDVPTERGGSPRPRPRRLTVVVPVFEERACLPELVTQLAKSLDGQVDDWELLAVDDGSTDGSFDVLRGLAKDDPRVRALRLSRNRGHPIALTCGLDHADGDVVVTMDADLQHPPSLLPEMIAKWRDGYDVVSMAKTATRGRGLFKSLLGALFYPFFNAVAEVRLSPGGSDFRLLDQRCVVALRAMPERRRFLRGLVKWIGFRQVDLSYTAAERFAGAPQYTVRKLAALAGAGFFSFSSAPLRLGLWLGGVTLVCAAALAACFAVDPALLARPFGGAALVAVLVLGALLLFCVGVVGAYVSVLLEESRRRPLYFVAEAIGVEPRAPG